MIKILFVCHGNICRSPMAEFVMKYLLETCDKGFEVKVDSKATSTEEIGNPPHRGTVNMLNSVGIPIYPHKASQMTEEDYDRYDYIIGMDSYNIRNIMRIIKKDPMGKVHKLMEYAGSSKDIADPWYTGDFHTTYNDVRTGCQALLEKL